MRAFKFLLPAITILVLAGCSPKPPYKDMILKIRQDIEAGNLSRAVSLADSLSSLPLCDSVLLSSADSMKQIAERIALDFSLDETAIGTRLRQRLGEYTPEQKDAWEKEGLLEYRLIDNRKMYFNRAASNLALLLSFRSEKGKEAPTETTDPEMAFRKDHTGRVMEASLKGHKPVQPVTMEIEYTLTVDSSAVPAGETVRCWLPYPASGHERQYGISLLETSEPACLVAPDSAVHKTIYMEKKAEAGKPTVFSIKFRYTSSAKYISPSAMKAKPYDTNSGIFRTYTAEQLPHICFTDNVKRMADSIAGSETDPVKTVHSIYMWFKNNIPWAGALEYSIMPNIPEYVLANRHGDCGMQTFLFMSMLRYRGIPVRWQSGWMVPPGAENLHDWCEVYYEGVGWVPADVSYDLVPSADPVHLEFYISGIDSFRMIVNNGVAGELFPPKRFLRSEPYDFQRGEVETSGGNLYFDKWDYHIDIKYLSK